MYKSKVYVYTFIQADDWSYTVDVKRKGLCLPLYTGRWLVIYSSRCIKTRFMSTPLYRQTTGVCLTPHSNQDQRMSLWNLEVCRDYNTNCLMMLEVYCILTQVGRYILCGTIDTISIRVSNSVTEWRCFNKPRANQISLWSL
jgi:hypothetical protein